MGVGGEPLAPAALPPGKKPDAHCAGVSVGPRAGLDGCGKSRPHRNSIPGTSNPSRVIITTAAKWAIAYLFTCWWGETSHSSCWDISVSIGTKQHSDSAAGWQPGNTDSVPYKGRCLSLLCIQGTFGPHSFYCPPGIMGKAAGNKAEVGNMWRFISTAVYVFMTWYSINHRWQLCCPYGRDLNQVPVDRSIFRSLLLLTSVCQRHGDNFKGLRTVPITVRKTRFKNRTQPTYLFVYWLSYHRYSDKVVQ